jgi:hypothetical protein
VVLLGEAAGAKGVVLTYVSRLRWIHPLPGAASGLRMVLPAHTRTPVAIGWFEVFLATRHAPRQRTALLQGHCELECVEAVCMVCHLVTPETKHGTLPAPAMMIVPSSCALQ